MMPPFLTIITPTVQRDSLIDTCESVDRQTYEAWEHIVIDDSAEDRGVLARVSRKQRIFAACAKPHRNGGNSCRHAAWKMASSVWVMYLDDDNTLYAPETLEEIVEQIAGIEEKWALFPIFRHGSRFFFDPPMPCYFDTGNAVVRREIAQWPDVNDYASDAIWLQGLKAHPYRSFSAARPIMTMEGTSFGAGGGINGQ